MRKRVKKSECPNCGHKFSWDDNFCGYCGQENHTHKLPLRHFFLEFLETTIHFDTKFFHTIKDLFLKPGLVTQNFNANRRARYVPPFRLYLFISAIYFVALSLWSDAKVQVVQKTDIDTSGFDNFSSVIADSSLSYEEIAELAKKENITDEDIEAVLRSNNKETTWLRKQIIRTVANFMKGETKREMLNTKILKNMSYAMFLLMPAFAALLMLFYYRKKMFYTEHLVFAVHFHTMAFILLLALMITRISGWELNGIAVAGIFIYLVFSLRNVYRQSWILSLFKTTIISTTYLILLVISIAGVTLASMS